MLPSTSRPSSPAQNIPRSRCSGLASPKFGASFAIQNPPRTPAIVQLPPSSPPRDRYLTRDERERLVSAAGSHHVRVFIELAIGTAGRSAALLELTWDRVDFDRARIMLRTSEGSGKGRAVVPMNTRLRSVLEEARTVALTDHVIEYAGKPVGSIKKAFARACAKAGLDDVSPHVLRHTAAVWMAEAGISMPEIATFLGHRDSRITERVYARFSPEYLSRAALALE